MFKIMSGSFDMDVPVSQQLASLQIVNEDTCRLAESLAHGEGYLLQQFQTDIRLLPEQQIHAFL